MRKLNRRTWLWLSGLTIMIWLVAVHRSAPEVLTSRASAVVESVFAGAEKSPRAESAAHNARSTTARNPQPTAAAAAPIVLLLERHQRLAAKAVPLGDERAELEALLANSHNLELVRDRLLERPRSPLDIHEQDERMQAVAFLRDALRYRANPSRTEAVAAVNDIVLAGNHRAASEIELKRSTVADKVELFQALAAYAPDAARELEHRGSESDNRKLLAYAARLAQGTPSVE